MKVESVDRGEPPTDLHRIGWMTECVRPHRSTSGRSRHPIGLAGCVSDDCRTAKPALGYYRTPLRSQRHPVRALRVGERTLTFAVRIGTFAAPRYQLIHPLVDETKGVRCWIHPLYPVICSSRNEVRLHSSCEMAILWGAVIQLAETSTPGSGRTRSRQHEAHARARPRSLGEPAVPL